MTVNPEPTLNFAEACDWLRMGHSTLRMKLAQGRGPTAIKLPGSNRWRFRLSDLVAYVNSGELPPPPLAPPYPSVKARRDMAAARRAKAEMDLTRQKKAKGPTLEPKPKRQRERERVTA